MAPAAIIACAQTLVIIGGGFDLSVGAMFALAGVIATQIGRRTSASGRRSSSARSSGSGSGSSTVSSSRCSGSTRSSPRSRRASCSTGVAQVLTSGYLVIVDEPGLRQRSATASPGASSTRSGCCWRCCSSRRSSCTRTTLGRYIFAVGGNAEAARLVGRAREPRRAARPSRSPASPPASPASSPPRGSRRARPNVGSEYTLTTIAAVVIGGTSILGGEGAVWRRCSASAARA